MQPSRHAWMPSRCSAHKHRSTIIHWAVEDWLRRYEPGIQARLSGGSQAAMAAKAPAPKPDPRQIDLEDALEFARSSFPCRQLSRLPGADGARERSR